ncbi:MAG: ABC transporter ATP-binding protein [Planctomycetota bacterium]|nr:MAG: ABC transporter ATP-binding protein [Planctomycetota bacterium]
MSECVISVEGVSKSFGALHVLKNVSLDIYRGQTVCILGRSGTGKSVLLKCIIGLLDPDQGTVTVLGKRFATMTEAQRLQHRRQLGYVFQGAALFDSLTVGENVGFSLYQDRVSDDTIRQRVTKRLEMVGLGHAIDKYPRELSGGMQKRVGLARALVQEPAIILYDEPTSGLDPLTTDIINQLVLRLRSQLQVTSLVVTHDIRSAFTIADHIIILDQGRILAQGSPEEIQNSDLPWVQHFVSGRALETELLDSLGTSSYLPGPTATAAVSPPSPALEPRHPTAIRRQAIRPNAPSDDNDNPPQA